MTSSSEVATNDGSTYGIRAVDRVCDIIELLGSATEPVPLPEIAAVSKLPKSSTFRYLSALESRRFVERTEQPQGYRLGSALASLRAGHLDTLTARAMPVLEALRDEFEETANLGLLDGRQIAYLAILESRRSVRLAARPNDRDDLHSTALGKAILASFDDERAKQLVGDHFPKKTQFTVTDWPSLLVELDTVRKQGYAVDDQENEMDGRCLAVKIPGVDAAISVSGPASRMTPKVVKRAASVMRSLAATLRAG